MYLIVYTILVVILQMLSIFRTITYLDYSNCYKKSIVICDPKQSGEG